MQLQNSVPTVEENLALVLAAQKGSLKARQEVTERNMPLVISLAFRWQHEERITIDDLIQEGWFGLNRAIDKFNPGVQGNFSVYAGHWIRLYQRREAKRQLGGPVTNEDGIYGVTTDDENLSEELRWLDFALSKVDPLSREMTERYYGGEKMGSLRKRYGMSASAIHVRKNAVVRQLSAIGRHRFGTRVDA